MKKILKDYLRELRAIPWRVKVLTTRKLTWVDRENGISRTVKEPWSVVWAIAGIHSYKWWWVKKYGELDCGCSRNPLTRRMILFDSECVKHSNFARMIHDLDESDD